MKILAIGASNNADSINRKLAAFAAGLIADAVVETLNIDDYELPLFSDARENQMGQPQLARDFHAKIASADGLVVSFAEHNGSYTAAHKNLFDWVSRIDKEVFQHKPVVFLATSPGPGGASSVLASAVDSAVFFGADLVGSLSVPNFFENYDIEANHVVNHFVLKQLVARMNLLRSRVLSNSMLKDIASTAGFPFS